MSDAQRLAEAHTHEAIGLLVTVMRDATAKDQDRMRAAEALIDRAHGKAMQALPPDTGKKGSVVKRLAGMSDDELRAVLTAARERRGLKAKGEGGSPPRGDPMGGSESGVPSALCPVPTEIRRLQNAERGDPFESLIKRAPGDPNGNPWD